MSNLPELNASTAVDTFLMIVIFDAVEVGAGPFSNNQGCG